MTTPKKDRLSWHFLKRRAEKRAWQIHRWQQIMKGVRDSTVDERLRAAEKLIELNVGAYDVIDIEATGKYDRRYHVIVKERVA